MTTTMDRPTGEIPLVAAVEMTRVIPAATIARTVYTGKHRGENGGIPADVLTDALHAERVARHRYQDAAGQLAAEQLAADTAAFIERLRDEAVV